MSAVVVFEWSFSPPDYSDVLIDIVRDDYRLTIANGKAEARLGEKKGSGTVLRREG
jgi:hypothetical protein